MLITLQPTTHRGNLLQALRYVHTAAHNLSSGQNDLRSYHAAYLTWVNNARSQLRNQISSTDLDRLVIPPRYGTLLSLQIPEPVFTPAGTVTRATGGPGPVGASIREMLSLEIKEHVELLEAVIGTLMEWSARLDRLTGPLVIADANVYCHHPDRLDVWEVGEDAGALPGQDVHLVLPLSVLDELDRQKDRGQGTASTNARETLKILDRLLPEGVIRPRGSAPENPAFPRGALTIDLWPDPPGHVRLPRADDEIIARAVAFKALAGREVILLTGDVGMSTRARLAGLKAIRLDLPDASRKQPKPPRGDQHPALMNANAESKNTA